MGDMDEKYKQFSDFNWADERWQSYLDGLYPTPAHKQLLKFKKKWYKRNIDPEFDDSYEPSSSSAATTTTASNGSTAEGASAGTGRAYGTGAYADDQRWAEIGYKAYMCLACYAIAIAMSVGALFRVLPLEKALVQLVAGFVLEQLSKHGFKFSKEYLQTVMMEDAGSQPFTAIAAMTPNLHRSMLVVTVIPSFITALLSVAQIAKACQRLPAILRKALAPLAEMSMRYQLMQVRSDVEVGLFFLYIIGACTGLASPMAPLLYGNIMRMRYAMSAWTQASFRKVDGMLSATIGRLPVVSTLYTKVKDFLYTLVDPERASKGMSCSIL